MNLQITPYMLPLFVSAAITLAVTIYAWQRRNQTPSASALALIALALTIWSTAYGLELSGLDLATKMFWGKVQYFGIVVVPYAWFVFACDHAGLRIPGRIRLMLLVVPVLTLGLALTTESHGLIWRQVKLRPMGAFSVLEIERGLGFWIHSVYSYLLLLGGAAIILRSLGRLPGVYTGQAVALVVAVAVPWLSNALYLLGVSPIPHLDLTTFAFTITVLALSWAIFGFQLVDLSPIARDVVVEQMQDGVIVLDAQNRINDINPTAQQMIGIPPSQVIGYPAAEVLSRWPNLVDRYRDVMTTVDEITIEEDGERRWYELRLAPLYGRRRNVIGRAIMLRNITDRKRVEARLRQLSRAVDASPASIVITDLQGRIEYVNPKFTQLTGYAMEEVVGQNARIFKTDKTPLEVHRELWSTISAGHAWQGRLCNRKKNGDVYWESAFISPIFDAQGEITHYVAVKEDVTEHQRLEQMRDDLIHTMVHDLRNPLNGIMGALDMLSERAAPYLPEKMDTILAIAQRGSERMLSLVNAILDINRLESGSMPLNCAEVALAEVVEDVLQLQSTQLADKSLQIENRVTADVPPLWVDRFLVNRVLQNLLDNSIKFTPDGGVVRLDAAAVEPGWVRVAVSNNGPRIEPEIREHLFDKFVTGSLEGSGNGLGLAFCRLAVEAHGGQIAVESDERETTFYLTLPLAADVPPEV
jgi:PAS domain S-box-containing protein